MSATADVAIERGGFELRGWRAPGAPALLCVHEAATLERGLATCSPKSLGERAPLAAYDRRGLGPLGRAPRLPAHDDRGADRRRRGRDRRARRRPARASAGPGSARSSPSSSPSTAPSGSSRRDPRRAAAPRPRARGDARDLGRRRVDPPHRDQPPASASARAATRAEAAAAGANAALELYLGGSLGALGGGAERIPDEIARGAEPSPFALFAEVAAISGWTLPLAQLPALGPPAAVVVAGSTPPFLRRAAEALVARLPGADLREVAGPGLAQLGSPDELAAIALELA